MTPDTSLIDPSRLAQMLFLAAFSVSLGLVLRVAHDWYPFTPTYTEERQWMGWRDVLRWLLAGIFLFITPFGYLTWALVSIPQSGILIPVHFPSPKQVMDVVALICLPIPLLGFYDIWQSIIRTLPSVLYSPHARRTIEGRYKTAFTSGRLQAFLLGLFWIVWPVTLFYMVSVR